MDDIIKNISDNPDVIKKWKSLASKEIKAWTKRTNPYRGVKPTNYYLYIDIRSKTYSIILQGVKPNAGAVRSYNAPVGKKEATKPYPAFYDSRWHTLKTKRKTANSQGVKPLSTSYYGEAGQPQKYYGLKKGGKIKAYGLYDDDVAVPIYSSTGYVEYITETNIDELYQILQDSGFEAIQKEI